MADNILVTPGSGATIAADDVGGILHQRVKLRLGADGSATDVVTPVDAAAQATVMPAGALTFHTAASTWYMARNAGADAQADYSLAGAGNMLYNGATYDRQRGNTEGTLLASAARTASVTGATQTNYNARGVLAVISVTVAGTGGLTMSLVDIGGGIFGIHAVSAPVVSTAVAVGMLVYPGVNDTNVGAGITRIVSQALPRTWRIDVTHADGSSWTYSVVYSLIV